MPPKEVMLLLNCLAATMDSIVVAWVGVERRSALACVSVTVWRRFVLRKHVAIKTSRRYRHHWHASYPAVDTCIE